MVDLSPAERLRDALRSLTASERPGTLTVSALCQLANVSRNSLYRYHRDLLETLRAQQRRREAHTTLCDGKDNALRSELAILRQQVAKLAALVDHYYAAYRESHALLSRREKELAELRRRLDYKPTRLAR